MQDIGMWAFTIHLKIFLAVGKSCFVTSIDNSFFRGLFHVIGFCFWLVVLDNCFQVPLQLCQFTQMDLEWDAGKMSYLDSVKIVVGDKTWNKKRRVPLFRLHKLLGAFSLGA